MFKLTDLEVKVVDHFHIVPNNFNGEGTLPTPKEIYDWVIEVFPAGTLRDEAAAKFLLGEIERKFWTDFECDSISIENTATWVLSHYFTIEQLQAMTAQEAEEYLKDWKYFCGFRKCDGWGDTYINNALDVLTGRQVLSEEDNEYWYVYA